MADTYDWSLRGQVSYAIDQDWEPFLRYDFINFDSDGLAAGVENQVHEFTVRVNYYLYGQALKFNIDASYLPMGLR